MLFSCYPCYCSFDSEAEAAVGDGAVFSQVEIPGVVFFVEALVGDLGEESVVVVFADGAPDDFAEAGRGDQVEVQDDLVVVTVGFHVERLCVFGVVGDEDGFFVHLGDDGLVGAAEVLAPVKFGGEAGVFGVVLDFGVGLGEGGSQVDKLCGDFVLFPLLERALLLGLEFGDSCFGLLLLASELFELAGEEFFCFVAGEQIGGFGVCESVERGCDFFEGGDVGADGFEFGSVFLEYLCDDEGDEVFG